MATLTIDSVSINADGRTAVVKVLATTSGGTYLFDSANAKMRDKSSAKVVFTVVSRGYSGTTLTTITRTVYGTVVSRHSGVEPGGHGTWEADEDASGSDLLITIALSEPIYAKDKTGAGNSGTAPVVSILANWYTKGADATGATGASFAVTNNSTLAYFDAVGQWDITTFERVTGDFRMAFAARHLHGIECVVLNAVGVTSSHSQTSSNITTQSRRQSSRTSLYGNAYEATIPISGFSQDEVINLRAYAYPKVGDVALDTNNFTVAGGYPVLEGRGPITHYCDKNGTALVYACVDSVNGTSGGTASTTLATADGDPFQTINQAIDANATMIYLVDAATHALASRSTNKSASYWITVKPHPNQSGTCIVNRTGTLPELRVAPCMFENVTIRSNTNLSQFNGSTGTSLLRYKNCYFDHNSITMLVTDYNFTGIYFQDCRFSALDKWIVTSGGDTHRLYFDGCSSDSCLSTFRLRATWRIVRCDFPGVRFHWSHSGNASELPRNWMVESSKLLKIEDGLNLTTEIDANRADASFCGNVIEGITATLAGTALISLVEATQFTVNNIITGHNTFVGQRCNWFYDDGAAAQTSIGVCSIGNIFEQWNSATDLFHNSGPFTGREGRWWYNFGTQTYASVCRDATATFRAYEGVDSEPDGDDPTFVNDLTGSTGGGDYHLASGSIGIGILTAGVALLAYDFDGNPIRNDGTGDAGAYQTIIRTATIGSTPSGAAGAASATFSSTTRTASVADAVGGAAAAASAAFTAPVFTGTIGVTPGGAAAAASATFVAPVFTGNETSTVGGAAAAASAQFATIVFNAAITSAAGGAKSSATATYASPTRTAGVTSTSGGAAAAASATFVAPVFTGATSSAAGGARVAATAQFATVLRSAAVVSTVGGAAAAANATFTAPSNTATVACTLGGARAAAYVPDGSASGAFYYNEFVLDRGESWRR